MCNSRTDKSPWVLLRNPIFVSCKIIRRGNHLERLWEGGHASSVLPGSLSVDGVLCQRRCSPHTKVTRNKTFDVTDFAPNVLRLSKGFGIIYELAQEQSFLWARGEAMNNAKNIN